MNAQIISDTFKAHGIEAQFFDTVAGPQVERHTFILGSGVKVSKATALDAEMEMALDATGVTIERVGSLIAVDVPRKARLFVDWAPLGTQGLEFFAGLGLDGSVQRIDLAKAPHLLIAGSTGSGKSVAINAILTDWLTRLGPDEIRLHLVDPKRVELGQYKALPQVENFAAGAGPLAFHAVAAVEKIMDERFKLFEKAGVRDIGEWNGSYDPMPFQVLVIDEFADLVLDKASGKDIEQMVVRIAQLGRAAGVHMILATQRPTANVFTGLIKANVPARWVFRVNTGLDSRIALDQAGAQALLGAGDSLFQAPGEGMVRLQAAAPSQADLEVVQEYGALLHPDTDEKPAESLELLGTPVAHTQQAATPPVRVMTDAELEAKYADLDAELEAEDAAFLVEGA